MLIYGSHDCFQSLQNIRIVKSKTAWILTTECNFYVPFYTFFVLLWVSGFHLYNCIIIQTAFVFKRTDVIFSLVRRYGSFLLSFIRMAFFEEFQLARVNIDILCIVSVCPRPLSAGQLVLVRYQIITFLNNHIEIEVNISALSDFLTWFIFHVFTRIVHKLLCKPIKSTGVAVMVMGTHLLWTRNHFYMKNLSILFQEKVCGFEWCANPECEKRKRIPC